MQKLKTGHPARKIEIKSGRHKGRVVDLPTGWADNAIRDVQVVACGQDCVVFVHQDYAEVCFNLRTQAYEKCHVNAAGYVKLDTGSHDMREDER